MIWKSKKHNLLLATVTTVSLLAWWARAEGLRAPDQIGLSMLQDFAYWQDTVRQDTAKYIPSRRPTFTPSDRRGSPFGTRSSSSPLLLGQPGNLQLNVELDDSLQQYNITETIGDSILYRPPSSMSMREYSEWQQREAIRNYWRAKSAGLDGESVVSSNRLIPKLYISPVFDRIFGGNYVDIQPNGNVSLKFGARFNRNENPTIPLSQQRTGDFDFDQNISLNLVGKIGEKMRLNFNWDNNANFDFENNMKLDYTGYEEEIIRKVEAGNVSLPLNNSLITGAQNLFGVKAQLQFGRLGVTTIASSVRGTNDEVIIQNGGQNKPFEIRVDAYDRDRHFYLSQFFRQRYDNALRNLPLVNSGIVIRRVELYVTNNNRSTENLRNMVAYMDLGEAVPYRQNLSTGRPATAPADNQANSLYGQISNPGSAARSNSRVDSYLQSLGLEKGTDFEHVRARRLEPNEYKFNPQLGYISLNFTLMPDQVLGVAFEYTYNGKTYKVGELMDDYQNLNSDQVIHMKLLRATSPSLNYPTWDLMMKNVYALDANQINREDFKLQVVYKDDETGVDLTSIKEPSPIQNIPLVEVLNLDNVNSNNDKPSDGNFDFLPGITIDPESGRIYFPQVEPFGDYLANKLQGYPNLIDQYVFQELYEQTQTDVQQDNVKAKFYIKGRVRSTATDEIMLPGFQIAEGSVAVYSGGTRLQEGTDYQVFYDLGRIKILNPSYLNSANDLRVTYEKAELLNIQPRTMLGARFDYRLNDDVNIGATVLHLNEQTFINRVSIGDEPTNNTIYGFDVNLQKESRMLTRFVDAIPLIQTKAPSMVTFSSEFAQLIPAKSKSNANEDGASYLDDFEGAETPYSLGGFNNSTWRVAATPAPLITGEGLSYAYNRAKLAWYTIDQTYYRSSGNNLKPDNITDRELENHYVRPVRRTEVFKGRDAEVTTSYEYTFDLAYYPRERGQYNYNPNLNPEGLLAGDPRQNWGGISREISLDTDFDNANIEYVEFWMMDPFIEGAKGRDGAFGGNINPRDPGQLVLNLGNVSEDILKDNEYAFENGLPVDASDVQNLTETIWGRVTQQQFLTDAFTGIPGGRQRQDVGLDGLNDADEANFFRSSFLDRIPGAPPQSVLDDPSADNFFHHLDPIYDQQNAGVLQRYKRFNGMENNSPENSRFANYAFPDKEDLNGDNVISDLEQYYEYKINLTPGQLDVGQNYIVDKVEGEGGAMWYQFRVPVRQPTGSVGNISGFKSIRFMRMYMTGFADPVVLRMAQFQLVANQWRKFTQPLTEGTPCLTCTDDARSFTVSTVNIEENGPNNQVSETNIPYVVPPGINRLRDYASTNDRRQNEQSLQLCVEDLRDSFSKAVFKNMTLDLLAYKQLKMFIHAQSNEPGIQDGEMQAFIRIGTDFTQNYYEYVVPLKFTPSGSNTAEAIWPAENEVNIPLQDLVDAKAERNINAPGNIFVPYTVTTADGKLIRVVGNPDFSEVEGIMIGIRNPSGVNDDARSHSACIWVNELRVTDFVNRTGWAANARLNAKLADFANVTATGAYTTVGFGSLQQPLSLRSRDNISQFDVSANMALDKFLPEQWGVKVPMTVQYGVTSAAPQYDPLDKDMPLNQSLTKFDNNDARDDYKKEVITQETRRSISLLNVRKERTNPEDKVRVYDIENFSFSYAYSERLFTNIETDRDYTKNYSGGLAYTYDNPARSYQPFANSEKLNSPYLRLIKDFNFSLLPSRFSFRADVNRFYNETYLQRPDPETRFVTTRGIEPVFQKSFFFNRIYDMRWDLTKSLTLDYTATNRSVVDEPDGRINSDIDSLQYKNKTIRKNLLSGGRNTNFNQLIALNYRLPFDKLPLTDWLSADTRYATNYIWTAGSTALNQDTTFRLGNTAENNVEFSVNGRVDLVKLYNKVRFLKAANTPTTPAKPAQPAATDTASAKAPADLKFLKGMARVLMMTRSLNVTYLENRGSMLPGYMPETEFFGFDDRFEAPGLPFILGKQYDLHELYSRMNRNGWYTDSSQYLNTPFSGLHSETFTARANLEPFRNLSITVDVRRAKSEIDEVFYRKEFDDFGNVSAEDQRQNPFTSGSFSTSFMALGTLFESTKDGLSDAFEQFIRNRHVVRDRLTAANPAAGDSGYSLNSQEVLLKSFLYAYQGREINGYEPDTKGPFSRLPIPNWSVTYNGLERLPIFQKWFSQISLQHAYNSSYNITSYSTSLSYLQRPEGFPTQLNEFGRLEPYYIVNQLTVVERLAPLMGINFRTKTNLTGRLEYKLERNLSLNLTNAQITETNVKDYVVGFGYTTTSFKIPFTNTTLDNELTMRMDLQVRDNQTVQRAISTDNTGVERSQNQITNGTRQVQLRPTVDYVLSQRLNLQFYVLRTVSDPKISTSFRNSVTEGGVQLRVSLQ